MNIDFCMNVFPLLAPERITQGERNAINALIYLNVIAIRRRKRVPVSFVITTRVSVTFEQPLVSLFEGLVKRAFSSMIVASSVKEDDVDMHYSSNNLISFLRTCCEFSGNWPLNSNVTGRRWFLSKVIYWTHFSNEFYGMLAILNGLHCCFTSLSEFVKSFVELVFMLETLFNLIYCRCTASQFQVTIGINTRRILYISYY